MELILLVINSIFFLFAIFGTFHLLGALEKIKNQIFKLFVLGGITILLFYSYFVYNGYQFWHTLQDKCKCADGWSKYYIYLQTILFFLVVLSTTVFAGYASVKKLPIGLVVNGMFANALANKNSAKLGSTKRSNKNTH